MLLHAKTMVVDDDLAVIGSSNLDIRSFTLNMEVSLILYGENAVMPLREVVERYATASDPVTCRTGVSVRSHGASSRTSPASRPRCSDLTVTSPRTPS